VNSHFIFLQFVMDNYTRFEYMDGTTEWTKKDCRHVYSEEQIWDEWRKKRKELTDKYSTTKNTV